MKSFEVIEKCLKSLHFDKHSMIEVFCISFESCKLLFQNFQLFQNELNLS